MAKVNLRYNPDLIFPWRVVYVGTDRCIQVCGESMAYYTESEAMRGIHEEGHELVDIKKEEDEGDMVPFIIAYESGLGKGWDIIGAIDAKDALEKFKEKETDIYKLCQSPYGTIHIAKEESILG